MKKLYLTILEILKEIPQIQWVDFNSGQLQQPMPSVAFPAVLVDIHRLKTENIEENSQRVYASFSLTLVQPLLGDASLQASEPMRSNALDFLNLSEEIYKKMQNFESNYFFPFERTAVEFRFIKGLNAVELHFQTAWVDDTANS